MSPLTHIRIKLGCKISALTNMLTHKEFITIKKINAVKNFNAGNLRKNITQTIAVDTVNTNIPKLNVSRR